MALLSRYFTFSRTIVRNPCSVTATSSRTRPLGYVICSVDINSREAGTFSKSNRDISANGTYRFTSSSYNIRTTQRTFVSRRGSAVNSKYNVKYLYGLLISSSSRTMCTIKSDDRICWNCKKKIGEEIFFCDICKIIQPPLTELTFFEIFGW